MKNLLLTGWILTITLFIAAQAKAMGPQEAQQLLEIHNQAFSDKETSNNVELCKYHNELVEASENKTNIKKTCPRNEGTETKDKDLQVQLQEIHNLELVMNEPEDIDSLVNHAISKMKRDFNR